MKVILRNKSLVLIQDYRGRYWITRRYKRKHDGRRRFLLERSVVYLPTNKVLYNCLGEALKQFNKMK